MKFKRFIFVLILGHNLFVSGQDSYDFLTSLPPDEKSILAVSSSNLGNYTASNGESFYEFKEDGVWIVSTIYSSISKETIRESTKYTVKNGYIFGVVLGDSLPCELEEDRYYFGMRNREQIIGGSSKHELKKVNSNSYIINFYENGGFTPSLFTFSGKTLQVQHFDYETGTTMFESIDSQSNNQKEGMNYITLNPTEKEWSKLDKSKLFISIIDYNRVD